MSLQIVGEDKKGKPVNNVRKSIFEAYRVLQQDGLAAWSLWGRRENCRIFTILPESFKAAGLKFPRPARSDFDLGSDPEEVRKLLYSEGFQDVNIWYQDLPCS